MITFSSCVKMVSDRVRKPRIYSPRLNTGPRIPSNFGLVFQNIIYAQSGLYHRHAISEFYLFLSLLLGPTISYLGKIFLTKYFHSLQNKSKLQELTCAHSILPNFYLLLSHNPTLSGICRLSWDPAGNLIIF